MRILVIEDDPIVLDYIKKGLKEAGHIVDTAENYEDGLYLASHENYNILIVDIILPKMDGLSIIKELRSMGSSVGIIIISALCEVIDKVKGLRSGADDYMVKPFAFVELLARIEALGKRTLNTKITQSSVLSADGLELNSLSRKVTLCGEKIYLQAKEFKLLEYLLKFKGEIVTRTMLLEAVWEYHFDPQTSVIDVHISRLRKKLNDKGNHIIKTVRGAGYIIEEKNENP